ncbi:hypothetical protein [Shimia aestuarii]|uniref:Sulfotransferase family protein n=1 Tax=Shimia aestuarii TaxID=254406 RepID=A0A1I4QS87_9RHOB|nr:hypothetical protein [Shimia aestuarii]SFM42901.1 hypothetical protein SAMN04488042_107107 [Shimia aestuarii]
MRWIVALRRISYARKYRRRHPGVPVPSEVLYYLHIGKTGGTFFKKTTKDSGSFTHEPMLLIPLGHNLLHSHLPKGSRFILGTRDPATRFVSGFLSRRRRGVSGRNRQSRAEQVAFARFESPNALAEALSAQDPATRKAAEKAMRDIRHVNEPHVHWFPDRDRLAEDIAAGRVYRVRQEALIPDMRAVFRATGFEVAPDKLEERPRAHVAPDNEDKFLSAEAEANLRKYYAADYTFLEWLDARGLPGASA